jgi:hypothetical protein
MKIITWISFSDLIANAAILNGVPSDRGLCVLQALAGQFFFPASWIWTTILTYLLYCLVVHGKITMPECKMHVITWGLCFLITVLPLTTSTYGTYANDDDACYLHASQRNTGGEEAVLIWSIITFPCVLFTTFFLMIYWCFKIFYNIKIQQIPPTQTVRSALFALMRYPIILFLTWAPYTIWIFISPYFQQDSNLSDVEIVLSCFTIWQGGITALGFFYNSQESRAQWISLFHRCGQTCGLISLQQDGGSRTMRLSSTLMDVNTTDFKNISVAEDFESDDVYYGRTATSQSVEVSTLDQPYYDFNINPVVSRA